MDPVVSAPVGMDERLDAVLATAGAVKGFLLSDYHSCMQNGDLVSHFALSKSAGVSHSGEPKEVSTNADDVLVDLSGVSDTGSGCGESVEDAAFLSASEAAELEDSVEANSIAGMSMDAHASSQPDALSTPSCDTVEALALRTSRRRQNYVSMAGCNEERSSEAMLVHLSGGFIVTSAKDQLGRAFYEGNCTAVAIVRSGNLEWIVTGFAVAKGCTGSQATLWRGCKLGAIAGNIVQTPSNQLTWFDLDSTVDDAISVCYKPPQSWSLTQFYGVFPEQEEDDRDEDEEFENDDYDDSPQYVLTARGNVSVHAIVTFELLNDINFIKGTGMDIYVVPGEDYEACDDPRVFWSQDFLLQTCIPAGRKSSMTGARIELKADMVYMLVPFCTQPLQFCIRVASEYELDTFDLAGSGSSDDDSAVGSLY
mmetsp:Transcript_876/g.2031  ORF Transcript_876/g.2031 Transcript_876/m.2031 type:complete len:424 (+) Transcript_876:175-1446(+)|eukprot:CAMPEP_0171494930 /NCGR_PEP_ID=MMETSP0958-20121227/5834_1 /TAXON_ID=87120 /ORGANISM="Aurantiochytrium limacinum, Strain ATCCMYA-1381" /LENGTH=423 /DNA_ID=CAMNT_0012028805 /DNA_START=87 /DNA_END=1358 /DNA_ORIENTATION=-